jgi:sporulation protein YlmC with PRC-barrel domain
MIIPINADVHCLDGFVGRPTYVIVNPITKEVTHLVVRENQSPHAEHLVPVRLVKETTPDLVLLGCVKSKLATLRPFIETAYVQAILPEVDYAGDEYLISPLTVPVLRHVLVKQKYEAIPPGELTIHRGTRVEATDGRVGRIDEFVIDPENGHITHMTLREGHLWGDKEISIPVSEIAEIEEDVVHLKLDKKQVGVLPTVKVKRAWL